MIGFLNVYKPSGVTSNFVVQKIKKRFNLKKIGHMGTLDPLACGILPIAVGKATRMFDYSLNKIKRYTAVFDFGYTTDSLDITGQKTENEGYIPSQDEIENATKKLIGKISQIPPIFSAKNVNGMRAYDLARSGVKFELKPKEIIIYKLDLIEKISDYQYKFDILCSSGTYIRAIGRDIANLLNTYACMSFLERTETGNFKLDTSILFDDILTSNDLANTLMTVSDAFPDFDIIDIDKSMYNDVINGKRPKFEKISKNTFIRCDNNIIGVAKLNSEHLILDTFLF